MRLLLNLKSLKDCSYDNSYFHKLRGFIYSLQRESILLNQHNVLGYKWFSFSNIFPAEKMRLNDKRSLIISSPNQDFIYYLHGRLEEIRKRKERVEIGEMQFSLESIISLNPKVNHDTKLITGTPIVLRIPHNKYNNYGIVSKRPFEYWRPEYDFNAFLKQLSENLIKKYNQYYNEKLNNISLFELFKFKKSVAMPKVEEGINIPIIGSIWEFEFTHLNPVQQKVLQLGLEAGFGEMNPSGFGFMNKVKNEESSSN